MVFLKRLGGRGSEVLLLGSYGVFSSGFSGYRMVLLVLMLLYVELKDYPLLPKLKPNFTLLDLALCG